MAAQTAGLIQPGTDPRRHLLPHPGDAEEHRRPHLAELGREVLRTAGEPGGVAEDVLTELARHPLGDVGQRQIAKDAIVGLGGGDLRQAGDRRGDVAMGEHHRLGWSGGAAGVHEGGDVIEPHRSGSPVDLRGTQAQRRLTSLHRQRPGNDEAVVRGAVQPLDDDHALQRR